MRDTRRSKHLILLAFFVCLVSLAINADRAYVTATTHLERSPAAEDNKRDGGLSLQGARAIDYLKQHGLFDRIKASVSASQHTEVKKLTASDGATNEYFGFSVGISGDTIAVGAYFDEVARGAVYVFERNKGGGDTWGQVKKLTALDAAPGDRLGYSVGISGDTVVAGAIGDDVSKGSAYIFERNMGGADNWGQVRKLTASDGATNDAFGIHVGISRGTVVVWAPFADSSNGSTYVYERNKGGADNWGEVKKLTVAAGTPSHRFGRIEIDGETIIVGAASEDSAKGAAYIFERNRGGTDNWGEAKKLTASDGVAGDRFGTSIAIDGDMVVVGAFVDDSQRGSAYVFERNKGGADSWGEIKKLIASDGAASDSFGISVRIRVATVVVGAAGDDSNKGSAYIYERNRGGVDNWGEVKKLTASDGAASDQFGISIGLSGATLVVGAVGDDASRGSAYTFVRQDSQLVQQRKPTASDGAAGDRFGLVLIDGDTLVVGATGDDSRKGSAYVFERNKGGADNWGQVRKLTASDGEANDQFGISIGVSGDRVVIGAVSDSSPFNRRAAYVFERNKGGPDNWGEIKKLASDSATSDGFGSSVAICDATVVVGAAYSINGSTYVFERNNGGADNWGQVKKLTASDGAVNDRFGVSVGISAGMIVVGADGDDSFRGSAYIFARNKGGANNWGEVRMLTASDGLLSDQFGFSLGINVDTIVIGAPSDDSFKGSAYIFERNKGGADNWGEVKKLAAPDGAPSEYFGAVGISGDNIVIGSFGDDSFKGSAYVFERNNGGVDNWGQVTKLTASDGSADDRFGGSVGIGVDRIVVGALRHDSGKGSAYIFSVFPEAVSVSAANFQGTALAPEMLVAAFGVDLATGTEVAGTIPLPTTLLGTSATVKDRVGIERLAQLFFVSPGQVNYYIPSGTAIGPATVKITSGSGQISFGTVEIATISPGIFSANSTGQGIAAALALRVRGAQQTYEQISRFDEASGSFVPIPVDLGPQGDEVFLVMFGTGFRFRSSESGVSVRVGGRTLQSLFTGAVTGFVGLDQMNISPLPRELAGVGIVNIEITIDGKTANNTTVSIK